MKVKRLLIVPLVLVTLAFLLFQFRFQAAKGVGRFLAKNDPLETCDVIFAPASRADTNFLYAVRLLKEGWGDRLVATAPKLSPMTKRFQETYGLSRCSWTSILKQVFQKEGFPLEKLTILEGSLSSFTDCQLLHGHWRKHPFQSVIVVTDGPHARRVRMAMDKVFGEGEAKILSCPSFPETPIEDFFAENDDYVLFVFEEYMKIAAYTVKYALK
ncbi:MAG: hypothetical protein SWE60_10655 [Thermodesulfobacteriota bacterium]|nr:hypothetical protein [Thermodesulfobacteriota bacterium]